MPVPAHRQAAPASPSVPAFLPQSEPRVHPGVPSFESVYRGPPPTIPKFTHPDPSEFARLRIALENLLPCDGTELFKYQILVDHLKLEEAKMIADANLNSPTPFTDTMLALCDQYGQPHQLALRRIASVLDSPDVRRGDIPAHLNRSPASEVAGYELLRVDSAYPFYCAVDRFYYGTSVAEVRVLPLPSLCWQ